MIIALSLIDDSLIQAHEYSELLISRFSILDSRVSKLKRLDLRDARIKFRETSRDCQLAFERYCSEGFMSPEKFQDVRETSP